MDQVVTKTGDSGITSLYSGERFSKSHIRFDIIGGIDELISFIGISYKEKIPICEKIKLQEIQRILFKLNSQIASTKEAKQKINNIDIKLLENNCELYLRSIDSFTGFVLPSSNLDVARAICRKVERKIVKFYKTNRKFKNKNILKFINRLSDYLFLLARYLEKERIYV